MRCNHVDQDLKWEDLFHDVFVDPTTGVNGDLTTTLNGQVGFKNGSTNGVPNVSTTMQLEEALTHAIQDACARGDEMGIEL
jgi:hypothetical protein